MVSVKLRGGLGNQLFQYATGRAHSLRTNSDLFLDLSQLDRDRGPQVSKRSLHLEAFDLPVEYVDRESKYIFDGILTERIPRIVADLNQSLATRLFKLYLENRPLTFDPRVLELPSDVIIDGYWQSERYFDSFTEILRNEISVSNPLQGENRQWYDRISETSSISVHVRRGDYVSLGWALPPAYYRSALNHICCETSEINLFFFSDDMDWVRAHHQDLLPDHNDFKINYIECNDKKNPHEDLRLMRTCDHHITANSSFSWWGAWLDDSEAKQIVAPDYWVHDSVYTLDIVPNRWTTVGW